VFPAQTFPFVVAIEIVGATLLFTVMVKAFEVAVFGEAQVLLEVTTQVTTSPFAKVDVLNVAALPPVLFPFIFHW
jgi:hypothetical protein